MSARPFHRIGIVNRGEPAVRCLRTIKALRAREDEPLEAVAFYSPVDREAPHVRLADAAYPLPAPRGDVQAFLDAEALVAALRAARCDAVWPGWGFLSEDPTFVELVETAGLVFLGPRAEVIRALGDKIGAKLLAEKASVPVAAWSGGPVGVDTGLAASRRIGFPVVVKASAGGGGRGIRIVEQEPEFVEAFRAAKAEARVAFGDDRLFVEQKLERARHVEVQIAADAHGGVQAVDVRDCSVQRRHQKVLEETPPPGVAPHLLAAIERAAVRVAREAGYVGVGTVEFMLRDEEFWFLEVNPRLQVEHGISEVRSGLDLVELQIRIARGERLPERTSAEPVFAIEARVCAEDPSRNFAPAPGRVARFDPALGPHVRLDSGVAAGTAIPGCFDSLVAKVIASGRDREEARARLAASLADFELVIEGGASNRGWLRRIVDHPDFRAGGVDTHWLERVGASVEAEPEHAGAALIAAAILSYQRRRALARVNFFANPGSGGDLRAPPSQGQEIDLVHDGEAYRLQVYAVGSWLYRVHLDGQVVTAGLRETDAHSGRLELGDRATRLLFDARDGELRVEIEGEAHAFGSQTAGQVRASTPAVVVGIEVAAGDIVESGQALGVLEAMKMELRFDAPVAGRVLEVRARPGQQVAAGEVLVVIEPSSELAADLGRARRITLPLAAPHDAAGGAARDLGEELRRTILGYDAEPDRVQRIVSHLESESDDVEPESLRDALVCFADVAQLFVRSQTAAASGALQPSNYARLRMYLRRIRAAGAGVDAAYLARVQRALRHYGIDSLEPSDALERAVLRLVASQTSPAGRDRLVLAALRHLARSDGRRRLEAATELEAALRVVSEMRGLVSDTVADVAVEVRYLLFERPEIDRRAALTTEAVDAWLRAADHETAPPPEPVLLELAQAPRSVFERVGGWLQDADPQRRAIALAAHVRRIYTRARPASEGLSAIGSHPVEFVEVPGAGVVVGASCSPMRLPSTLRRLGGALREGGQRARAIDLFIPLAPGEEPGDASELAQWIEPDLPVERLTVNWIAPDAPHQHWTARPGPNGFELDASLHGIHPRIAARVGLERLRAFDLERLPAPDDIYCFLGRSPTGEGDDRVFVLADLRRRAPGDAGSEAAQHVAAFEHTFYEATRALRNTLAERDPKRRLQWNRIQIVLAPEIFLDPPLVEQLADRLAPATRNLGLEKVVVRVRLLDRERPNAEPVESELVISDVTGSHMTIVRRHPHHEALTVRSAYERHVAEARRLGLVHPYELLRMLTEGGDPKTAGAALPPGRFVEYDLAGSGPPRATPVEGRPAGGNRAGVVFGVIETPTEKVPEGMRRVVILSDPTLEMGALGAAECDRIVAALDLAESLGVPTEWVAISAGARIAMDSGTENLDATARVVRRIVEVTQRGGVIHMIVAGINVGAQSYWNALATMLPHTRGALIMTPRAAMVLTGRAALQAAGSVSAEDDRSIGGYERVMGANGEAQYSARDLADAYRVLYEHYRYTYVVPGETGPRPRPSADPASRSICDAPYEGDGFERVGEIFDAEANPDRKRPFAMRAVMEAVVDRDGGRLERWPGWVGAETAVVWDAHIGGQPVCLLGIESQAIAREGYRPDDGPEAWTGGTLFPQSSKKLARALNAASGNRPAVVLANLSGFDGSPESMRKLQLEYGAEIARAVVNFEGPLVFLVVSRYHGGAYVVFSRALNPALRASAVRGSFASVIGGAPAAAVVLRREVRARVASDSRLAWKQAEENIDRDALRATVELEKQAELAAEFDAIHTVERALAVGSLEEIVDAEEVRAFLVRALGDEARSQGR